MSDDKKLKLNDILHLTKNQIENTKIGLNMGWQGRTHLLDWYESDPNGELPHLIRSSDVASLRCTLVL